MTLASSCVNWSDVVGRHTAAMGFKVEDSHHKVKCPSTMKLSLFVAYA